VLASLLSGSKEKENQTMLLEKLLGVRIEPETSRKKMLTSMPQLSMQIWLLIGQINENKA
jgi:hypothetical protein